MGCRAARSMPSTCVTSSRAKSPSGDFRPSNRSSRSLSDRSIRTPRASACLTVKPDSCLAKNFSMNKSFSSSPRRQRQRSLLRARSSSRASRVLASMWVIGCRAQTARITIISLILPMALVGFRPLGQTSTQFMMVWQRNRRYGSSRLSRRSLVASSRLSAMKR